LGKLSRDSGHMRVPDPPHMITGMILVVMSLASLVATEPGVLWTNRCGEILNLNHAVSDVPGSLALSELASRRLNCRGAEVLNMRL
jgi:hypothetical protein